MKKRGVSVIVTSLWMLILFVVLMQINNQLFAFMYTAGEDKSCTASAISNAKTKVAGVQSIYLDCPLRERHKIIITLKDLRKDKTLAKKMIDEGEYLENDPFIFNMHKIIAEQEMKPCWEKLGNGELPLFAEWWNAFTCDGVKCELGDFINLGTAVKYIALGGVGTVVYDFTIGGKGIDTQPPTFCVPCSKVTFADDVIEYMKDKKKTTITTTFTDWLKRTPAKPHDIHQGKSYYEVFEDPDLPSLLYTTDYSYDVEKPLAVNFERTVVFKAWDWASDALDLLGIIEDDSMPIDYLHLKEYDNIGENCILVS